MKKFVACLLSISLLVTMLAACNSAPSSTGSTASDSQAQAKEPQVVTFWYSHKGDEAKVFEDAIAAYNESQNVYKVEGLSVTDAQKIIVALAGNEAPDVIQCSSANIINYQAKGLLQSLQGYIDAEGYESGIVETSLNTMRMDGEQYGLAWNQEIIQLFYNKDILESIGYSEPPKTVDEMYEMAVKATQLDADGNIDVLGYPLFPLASARQELIYAFGGRWWAEDGKTLTPDDPKILDSLNMNMKYRELYGIDKVQAFVATANTNRYTEQDMFFAGKQLFRIDGQWLPTMIQNFGSDVNWGVALLPSAADDPDGLGTSRYETTGAAIPINAVNKEGAWDFIKWLTGPEGAKMVCAGNGWLPANESLYEDPDLMATPCFPEFIDALKNGHIVHYPTIADSAKYTSLIEEHLDYVYTGSMTPEDAMAQLAERAQGLS